MSEFRRLRTQDERGRDAWRLVAESRPGFATYEVTPPGSPSWWRRAEDAQDIREAREALAEPGASVPLGELLARYAGPAPVDGETCAKWCGYCHRDPEPTPDDDIAAGRTVRFDSVEEMDAALAEIPPPRPHTAEWLARSAADQSPATPDDPDELRARITEALATGQPQVLPSGNVIIPRRRWWHRLTRPNRKD